VITIMITFDYDDDSIMITGMFDCMTKITIDITLMMMSDNDDVC